MPSGAGAGATERDAEGILMVAPAADRPGTAGEGGTMVAVRADPRAASALTLVTRERRELYCPCGRYVGESRVYGPLPARLVWTKAYCRTCSRWRWFDAATGEPAAAPMGPDAAI